MSEIIPKNFGEYMERIYDGIPTVIVGIVFMGFVTILLFT